MRGVTGPLEVFEGNKGFKDSISGPFEIDWSRENLERADLVIRPEFVELMKEIASPCGLTPPTKPLSPVATASLSGVGPLAAGRAFSAPEGVPSPLAPWLFGIAMAAAVAELFLRRRS